MGKIIASIYLSLDGVMEEPAWTAPFWNDELSDFQGEVFKVSDALLLGRVTYEGMAAAWPNMEEEGAARMNSIPKYVPTTTLGEPQWNASFIKNNMIEEVAKLKQETDKQYLIYGSGHLTRSLMEHNLIDEYHLIVCPVVLGKGKRLFTEQNPKNLKLVDVKKTSTGVAILTYQASE
ncbi:dihydrofolate reductase family protein [Paenibacillus crassostreae]|uniref:Pyrimidine reductase n=1 Tax=Paenibacillus crassostreae TaxID=1763538 RepID=A0A167AVT7_9BACL|nr:dihydrofolate reductase family protein [Paenibacillus crassostreae]AOZ93664.1 pyrimidine reductase [Paenibacillus crassostreae]OAB71490.1 pyrimidine reductase [Paenibacillus crassostreae]